MRRRLHHKALKGVLAHGHLELDLIWSVKRSRRRDEHRESSRGRLHLLRAAAPKGDAGCGSPGCLLAVKLARPLELSYCLLQRQHMVPGHSMHVVVETATFYVYTGHAHRSTLDESAAVEAHAKHWGSGHNPTLVRRLLSDPRRSQTVEGAAAVFVGLHLASCAYDAAARASSYAMLQALPGEVKRHRRCVSNNI